MISMRIFLKHVDISILHDKICNFRNLEFKKLSYREVQQEVAKVISFVTPYGNMSALKPSNGNYPIGSRFYRVRSIPADDHFFPLKCMSTEKDCWEPPNEYVKPGRLNKEKEALLYTSPAPQIAVEEMKIKDNQHFALIVYEAVEQINITIIGAPIDIEHFSKDEILKLRMIQDFLCHEFIRDVGEGTEYLYKISESIAKDYFELTPERHDAWCYPSVAKKGGFNICFRPSSRKKLKLIGAQILSTVREDEEYLFNVKRIVKKSETSHQLTYHEVGSAEQISLFPEIIKI